jgi:DNA-binding CsgD family transcriptional regulator
MSGPLELIAASVPPGARLDGVLAEIDRVQALGGIRVLDMLLVERTPGGEVAALSLGQDEDFGDLLARLMPIGDAARVEGGDATAELWALAQSLPAGASGVFFLVEHRWAQGIFDAIEEQGGAVLGAGLLSSEIASVVQDELMAVEDMAQSIAIAQAAEAEARLRTVAARAEADQAVAALAEIRAQAAAEAVRVLTVAGLVESAATHEALDALIDAGLIIASAEEIAVRAVDADTVMVAVADEAAAEAIEEDVAAIEAAQDKRNNAATAASVIPAEIRVLRYLPTKLTFALIADKLGISRGAAKQRAERLYQKLGVHTRGDAVERARTLRVLP